jgi:hypothetical protein
MSWNTRYALETTQAQLNPNPSQQRMRSGLVPTPSGTPLHQLKTVVEPLIKKVKRTPHFDQIASHMNDIVTLSEGDPEKLIRIYRAVPKHIDTISHGDYVTTSIDRATQIANNLDGHTNWDGHSAPQDRKYHIISSLAPAKHLISPMIDPDHDYEKDKEDKTLTHGSPYSPSRWSEFGYFPSTAQ